MGLVFIVAAVAGLAQLTIIYSPFQAAVLVVAPFIVIGALVSIGVSVLIIAVVLPEVEYDSEVEFR